MKDTQQRSRANERDYHQQQPNNQIKTSRANERDDQHSGSAEVPTSDMFSESQPIGFGTSKAKKPKKAKKKMLKCCKIQ